MQTAQTHGAGCQKGVGAVRLQAQIHALKDVVEREQLVDCEFELPPELRRLRLGGGREGDGGGVESGLPGPGYEWASGRPVGRDGACGGGDWC